MTSKKELQVAYGLALVLFIVSVFCYAAVSARQPDEPVRMVFKSAAGKVLFDHQTHTGIRGYGLSCSDCHHHPTDTDDYWACSDCHLPGEEDALPDLCMDCHSADEIEDYPMMRQTDAFHDQCIQCHKDYGAGPLECAECHMM